MRINFISGSLLIVFILAVRLICAQSVGINTTSPDASSALDIVSTSKGMLIPRMDSGQRTGISSPAVGLLVFDTQTESFWYHQSTGWLELSDGAFTNDGGTVRNTGNDDTDDFVFGSASLPASTPISDTLMFFDKSKGAFRVGTIDNTNNWSSDSIGFGSFASGTNTKAIGTQSTAMGYLSRAAGYRSTAIGRSTTATGITSLALGNSSVAVGDYSTAIGGSNNAIGYGATVMGVGSTASGDYSFAMGTTSSASGNYSTAMGASNSIGFGSIAMGVGSLASGDYSTAIGTSNAIGFGSTAIGLYTKSTAYNSHAIGRYNKGLGDSLTWVNTDPVFEVGIGTSDSERNNAMTILKNGNVGIGTSTPTAIFQIKKDSDLDNPQLELLDVGSGFARLTMKNEQSPEFWTLASSPNIDSTLARFNIYYSDKGDVLSLQGDGDAIISNRLAVGTNTPLATLHANSPTGTDALRVQVNGATKMIVLANGGTSLGINNGSVPANGLFVQGNTGLGVNNATEKLEVNGNVNITGGIMANGVVGTDTQVLGANGSGQLIWKNMTNSVFTNDAGTVRNTGNNDTDDFVFGSESLPSSELVSDTLLFFDKSKGAFRVGRLTDTRSWSPDSIGISSFASGVNTKAIGDYTTSMGFLTASRGFSSTAIGRLSNANGDYATALGTNTTAQGDYSTALGRATIAKSYSSIVMGSFNEGLGVSTNWVDTDPILEVGIGQNNENRKNALTILKNGNIGIKGSPDADLHIYHTNNGGSGGLKLQNGFNNEFARFYISSGDGNLRIYFDTTGLKGTFNDVNGVYSTVSDRRLKENFQDLPFEWNTFNQLKPLSYTYKQDAEAKTYIGLVAQDVEEIYPQLVTYSEDEDRYTMDYSGFGVIAIQAIQEQQKIIIKQEQTIESQNEILNNLQIEFNSQKQKNTELETRLIKLETLLNK